MNAVDPPDSAPAPQPSRRLWAGVGAFSIALTAIGYAVVGSPAAWRIAPGDSVAAAAEPTDAQVEQVLAELVERLKKEPGNAQGWAMLGRSYLMLGRPADAVPALERLVALAPTDAQAHADLADAKARAAGRVLRGEPERLIARALELDPKNLKALAIAGSIAFDRGAYAQAIRHWEDAIAASSGAPGESELATNLRAGIAAARQRAGVSPPPAAGAAAAASAAQVGGRVTLAAALAGKASPDDTLFVFARAADGPRMPLALLKRQVKDLPLEFTLDDSLAMSPAAKLSGAKQVVIGARISKSGTAAPQAGDLQGFSAKVPLGTTGVTVEISEAVKPGP